MERGRILAMDYGAKNVGLACSDRLALTVSPLPSLPNRGRRDLIARIRAVISEQGIERILVGIPLHMNGSAGEAVRRVERFMEVLRTEFDLPLAGFDERLSTAEAIEIWREMSSRRQKKYRTVDSLAAALILQRYLEEA